MKKASKVLSGVVLGLDDRLQVLRDIYGGDVMVVLLVQKDKQPVVISSSLAYQSQGDEDNNMSIVVPRINPDDKRITQLRSEITKAHEQEHKQPDYVG